MARLLTHIGCVHSVFTPEVGVICEKSWCNDRHRYLLNIVTTQSIITDIALDNPNSILFWSEHTKPYTGRIVRATMDGQSTMWLIIIVLNVLKFVIQNDIY